MNRVATIGFFDGVHRGHQFVVRQVAEEARKRGLEAVVVTFDRPPREVVTGQKSPLLTTLDEKKHRVEYDGKEISLTNREFEMLKVFLTNQDIVLSRDTLLEKVCGYDYVGETNVVDVYVRFLRSKIDEAFDIKMIETVRGVGYVIKSE